MTSRIPTAWLGAIAMTLAGVAFAQAQQADVPPPPGINDPGVKTVLPAPPKLNAADLRPVRPATAVSIPALPSMRDPKGESPPTVTVRKEGNDTVQEYSHNGQIYMIRITPKHGVTQTFIDTDGDGRLEPDPRKSKIAPVFYTLYEWD